MPRRSPHDIPPVAELARPEPPEGLDPEASAIWRCVTRSLRPKWFSGENLDLLRRYCFAQAESTRLETEMLATPLSDRGRTQLVRQYKDMTATALSYARALRLSPRSNQTPRSARANGREEVWSDAEPGRQVQPYEL